MQKPSSVNADGIFEPFSVDAVPWEDYSHGDRFGTRVRQLGAFGGCSHVGVCMEELAPGKRAYPAHYHLLEEEHLLILEGSVTLQLGGKSFELSSGGYVCFPAGQKAGHATRSDNLSRAWRPAYRRASRQSMLSNNSGAPCRYLIIGERNPNDVIVYTDSGRVGVRLTGEGYRKSATMDYWEGESG
jgi:uncharacterized cupin superfamily protein